MDQPKQVVSLHTQVKGMLEIDRSKYKINRPIFRPQSMSFYQGLCPRNRDLHANKDVTLLSSHQKQEAEK